MDRRLVLLLGMHRSGTSLAARCFAAAGLPLGDRLLREPRADNPDGYWEDADILAAHEALLQARFGRLENLWTCEGVEDAGPPLCRDKAWADALENLTAVVRQRTENQPVFGFKDPRTARLLPLWKEIARRLDIQLVPVLLLRHPSEVAASLETRNNIPRALGELMWLRSVADILAQAGDLLVSTVVYADWFDHPARNRRAIGRTLESIGIAPAAIPRSIINSTHRHARSVTAHIPLTEQVYQDLVATRGRPPVKRIRAAILNRIDSLTSAFGGWRMLAEIVARTQAFPQSPSVSVPLPKDGQEAAAPSDPWRVIPGTPDVANRNRWCQSIVGGYLLHANVPGAPATSLLWHGQYCSKPARFLVDLAAGSELCPELDVELTVTGGAGDATEAKRIRLAPGTPATASTSLPADAWHQVRLSVAVAAPAQHAHHAALLVYRPRVMLEG